MNTRSTFIIFCLFLLSGCTVSRFNDAIGHNKQYALETLGTPKQVLNLANGYEVWSYPTEHETTWSGHADEDSELHPILQGVSEGIADTIIDHTFGMQTPRRNLYFDRRGIAVKWVYQS